MNQPLYEQLLLDFGREMGIKDLKPDEAGLCQLRFDDVLDVYMIDDPERERILIQGDIDNVSSETPKGYYQFALEANLFLLPPGEASLGFNSTAKDIVLSQSLPVAIALEEFSSTVNRFVNAMENLRERFSNFLLEEEKRDLEGDWDDESEESSGKSSGMIRA